MLTRSGQVIKQADFYHRLAHKLLFIKISESKKSIGIDSFNKSWRRLKPKTYLIELSWRLNTLRNRDLWAHLTSIGFRQRLTASRNLDSLKAMKSFKIERPLSGLSTKSLLKLEALKNKRHLISMRRINLMSLVQSNILFSKREFLTTSFETYISHI